MRCPKQLRNGPCGGTRADYHCEVYPERYCVWWKINDRSKSKWLSLVTSQRKLRKYHKPIDNRLVNTSAWVNMFDGTIEKISFSKDIPEDEVALPKKQ